MSRNLLEAMTSQLQQVRVTATSDVELWLQIGAQQRQLAS